jgi:hypothetical protein
MIEQVVTQHENENNDVDEFYPCDMCDNVYSEIEQLTSSLKLDHFDHLFESKGCHYFNNDKECLYENMFSHQLAGMCT